jgi:hypothetical protein
MTELAPIVLDRSFGRNPIGRMKREQNWGLEERIRTKEIKTKKY